MQKIKPAQQLTPQRMQDQSLQEWIATFNLFAPTRLSPEAVEALYEHYTLPYEMGGVDLELDFFDLRLGWNEYENIEALMDCLGCEDGEFLLATMDILQTSKGSLLIFESMDDYSCEE